MQTNYQVNYDIGREGLTQGMRKARPFQLPQLVQIESVDAVAGATADDWEITIVDDETEQSYLLDVPGDATEATLLANALAAFAAHDSLRNLFTLAGVAPTNVELTFTAKHGNRSYTFSAVGGPSGTTTIATDQSPGGTGLDFGRFVARDTSVAGKDDAMRALQTGDAITAVVGALPWSDGAALRLTDGDSPTTVDLAARGRHYAIAEEARMQFRVEQAVTTATTPFVRINGAGRLGGLRADADGGDAVDASSICSFESSAAADELVWVKIHLGAQ